jgi:hypothetical protein
VAEVSEGQSLHRAFGPMMMKLLHDRFIFKYFLGFFNPNFSFVTVTKSNVLDRILFNAKVDTACLRGKAPRRSDL